jgi:hypothetical protein
VKISTTISTALATAATVVNAACVGIVSAPTASADQATDASTHGFGSQGTLGNGDVVQGWTITDLKPSADAIPYPVQGALWEANATDEAIKGYVTPIVPNLFARNSNGQTYRALYQVATSQGVNPATLAQGQKTTGKVYFDVTGDKPDGVVYSAGGQDLASWVNSQTLQRRSGAMATPGPVSRPAPSPALPATPPPPTAPAAAGSRQIPLGGPVTPDPAHSQGTRGSGSQGTPIPVNSLAPPAPEASPAPPAPAGDPEVPADSPALPAPASGALAPQGTSGIPPAGAPSTLAPASNGGSAGIPAVPAPQASPAVPAPQVGPAPPAPTSGPEVPAGSPALPAPASGAQAPRGSSGTPAAGAPSTLAPAGNQGSAAG